MRRFTAGLTLLLFIVTGCRSEPKVSDPAPLFELKDLSGKPISLASFRGKVVMLDFWATWCGPCRLSIPMVQHFYQLNKDKGLVVLGVNIDEDPSGVYSFVKQFGMTYPVLYGGGTSVPDAYRLEGIPLFIFIDTQGRIVRRFEGFRPDMAEAWDYEFKRLSALKQ